MNTVTNVGVGLTTQAGSTNWTRQAQQTTILDAVNPAFLRNFVLSTNGVRVVAKQNRTAGININDLAKAFVTVDPTLTWPPIINTQPVDIFSNARANANINIVATVEFATITPISYQWQASNTNGNTWTNINAAFHPNITGFNTNTLAFTPLNIAATWNFRCFAFSNSGNNTSNFSNITTISAPTNQSVTHPAVANFNVAVTGPGSFSYLWQISTDGGTVYSNLADNSVYIGTNTNFLNVANSTGLNGFKYRCAVNNAAATVNSNNATLTVA